MLSHDNFFYEFGKHLAFGAKIYKVWKINSTHSEKDDIDSLCDRI